MISHLYQNKNILSGFSLHSHPLELPNQGSNVENVETSKPANFMFIFDCNCVIVQVTHLDT